MTDIPYVPRRTHTTATNPKDRRISVRRDRRRWRQWLRPFRFLGYRPHIGFRYNPPKWR